MGHGVVISGTGDDRSPIRVPDKDDLASGRVEHRADMRGVTVQVAEGVGSAGKVNGSGVDAGVTQQRHDPLPTPRPVPRAMDEHDAAGHQSPVTGLVRKPTPSISPDTVAPG